MVGKVVVDAGVEVVVDAFVNSTNPCVVVAGGVVAVVVVFGCVVVDVVGIGVVVVFGCVVVDVVGVGVVDVGGIGVVVVLGDVSSVGSE